MTRETHHATYALLVSHFSKDLIDYTTMIQERHDIG